MARAQVVKEKGVVAEPVTPYFCRTEVAAGVGGWGEFYQEIFFFWSGHFLHHKPPKSLKKINRDLKKKKAKQTKKKHISFAIKMLNYF